MDRDSTEEPTTAGPARTGSAIASVVAGIVIPVAAVPLVAVALPVAIVLNWWLMEELLGREIAWYERERGGMRMMADAVAAVAVGAIAVAGSGVPLVKYVFRKARPKLLYRTGAVTLLLIAAALWYWSTRNSPEYRFSAFWVALLGWGGGLLGLSSATWGTEEGARAKAIEDARLEQQRKAEAAALLAAIERPPDVDEEPAETRHP